MSKSEERTFTISGNAFQFADKHLHDRLQGIRHQLLKGRIPAEEAKRLGAEAFEAWGREGSELMDREAGRQGFEKSPIDLFPEKRISDNIEKWNRGVDVCASLT